MNIGREKIERASLNIASLAFLEKKQYTTDDTFPSVWHDSEWSALLESNELDGLQFNKLKNSLLCEDGHFNELEKKEIADLAINESVKGKLKEGGYLVMSHLPHHLADDWWYWSRKKKILNRDDVAYLKDKLYDKKTCILISAAAAAAPLPTPPLTYASPTKAREQNMTEFFEETKEVRREKEYGDNPVQRLENVVRSVFEVVNRYPPAVYVVNSIGSGKTHTCLQLCKTFSSAYFMCKMSGAAHSPNEEIVTVVQAIDAAESLNAKNIIAVCFIRAVEKALRAQLTAKDVFELQFHERDETVKTSKGETHLKTFTYVGVKQLLSKAWTELATKDFQICLLGASEGKLSPESKRILSHITKTTPNNLSVTFENVATSTISNETATEPTSADEVIDRAESVERSCAVEKVTNDLENLSIRAKPGEPLLVIFDEADGLLGKKYGVTEDLCPLRCIQRAIEGSNMIGIYLCTTSRFEDIEKACSSGRTAAEVRDVIDPFIQMCSHDLFQDHPFFLGRPLWKKQFLHREHKDMGRLVSFARSKLMSSSHNTNALHCALFALRFGFEPVSGLCSEFVADYMAVMVRLTRDSDKKQVAVCRWLSEPILAEVSSSTAVGFGHGHHPTRSVVRDVRYSITGQNIIRPSTGDRGEVVVGALLGYTLDVLKAQHIGDRYNGGNMHLNMSCSAITASLFLGALGIDAPPGSETYYVNFTHFMRVESTVTEETCYQAVHRRAALYVTAGAKALDLVVVAFRKDHSANKFNFLPIRVQVKNHVNAITMSAAVVLAAGMSPASQCQPVLPDGGLEIGIVIATGTGGTKQEGVTVIDPVSSGVKTRRKSNSKYYGYLLSVVHPEHFKELRKYKGSESKDASGQGALTAGQDLIADLVYIAQNHAVAELHDCFTDWIDRHCEGVQDCIKDSEFADFAEQCGLAIDK